MLDTLDSRALRRTDCFGQRFMRPGTYAYSICPAHSHAISSDRPFTITAKETATNGKMKQHNVLINLRQGRYDVAAHDLTIDVGDLVLWNCVDSDAPPYAIIGDQPFFCSHRMTNECGYSHAFGTPGEYHWADAFGGDIGGVIKVRDPGCKDDASLARWKASLAKGTLVIIADGKAKPKEVDIHTGQTVYFAIVTGPGISITDERVLATSSIDPDQCRPTKMRPAKR